MSITTVPSAITGQTLSAANWNTQVRDNINGIWVLTTAGDMLYATGASAASRLALVVGGVLYGGASAPAWLAKPSVDSLLKNTTAGVPSWLALTSSPGVVHTKGTAFTNSLKTVTSTTFADVGATFKVDLVTTVTCTIIAWAFGTGYKDAASFSGYFALSINGVTDPNGDNVRLKSISETPFSCMYYATGIAAGTRTVILKGRTDNAGDPLEMKSGVIYTIAIPE